MSTNHPYESAFAFSVAATVPSVSVVVGELRAILDFGSSDEESELMIAITEIAHNAVSAQGAHGDPSINDSPIEVAVGGRSPIVSITDHGGGFHQPPSTMPSPDATSGRGLLLARAFVPSLEIFSTGDGTTVRLPMRTTTSYRSGPPHSGQW